MRVFPSGASAWIAMALAGCVRGGFDAEPRADADAVVRPTDASGDANTSSDSNDEAGRSPCDVGLAILSPAEGATITTFEHTFTGTCDDALLLEAESGPGVTIIETSCSSCALRIVVGFTHVEQTAEDRTVTVRNGSITVRSTVSLRAACPPGYAGVSGDEAMGTSDFCVAVYEMKKEQQGVVDPDGSDPTGTCGEGWDPSWEAVSTAEGLPWSCLTFDNARASCDRMDDNVFDFSLVTNDQWQTIARNIESNPANWTAGGVLKQGSIGKPCAGSDPDACYELSGKTDRIADTNSIARHVLRNGEQVWDLSGNVWDMVDPDGRGGTVGYVGPVKDAWYELDSIEAITAYDSSSDFSALDFAPLGDYADPMSEKGVGKIYLVAGTVVDRGIARGGHFGDPGGNGLFAAYLGLELTTIHPLIGFRCAASVVQR